MTTLTALQLAQEALEHSEPVMKHYPEPVERHAKALAAVREAMKDMIHTPECIAVNDRSATERCICR